MGKATETKRLDMDGIADARARAGLRKGTYRMVRKPATVNVDILVGDKVVTIAGSTPKAIEREIEKARKRAATQREKGFL